MTDAQMFEAYTIQPESLSLFPASHAQELVNFFERLDEDFTCAAILVNPELDYYKVEVREGEEVVGYVASQAAAPSLAARRALLG